MENFSDLKKINGRNGPRNQTTSEANPSQNFLQLWIKHNGFICQLVGKCLLKTYLINSYLGSFNLFIRKKLSQFFSDFSCPKN